MTEHEWERGVGFEFNKDITSSPDWEPMITWVCRRCDSTVTAGAGTLAEVLGKDTDCDVEMVRTVMES